MSEQLPLIQMDNGDLNRSRNSNQNKKKNKKTIVKKSTFSSSKAAGGPLDFLKTTNDWLEDVPTRIIAAYENFIGDGENLLQSKVDKFCAWLAWKVNIAIERKRQTILRILHDQYQTTAVGKVMRIANVIQSFYNDPIGTIASFASTVFGPVGAVFRWVGELVGQVIRLAANLAKIMGALPPSPPNPHINYDKFKLQVKSISMAEITSDPSSLPSPETMFPEPPKPFTKETFTEEFEDTSAHLKTSQMKYTLSEDDKKALSGFNTNQSLADIIKQETSITMPDFSL